MAGVATAFERSRRHWLRYLALPAGQDAAEWALTRAALAELLQQLADGPVADLREFGLRDAQDAGWFTALGAQAMVEHEARPSTKMIALAVAAFEEAVALTLDTADERAMAWSNLGIALRTRYHATGDCSCLGRAVAAHRNALAATPDGQSSRPTRELALAMTLLARFEEDAADVTQTGRQFGVEGLACTMRCAASRASGVAWVSGGLAWLFDPAWGSPVRGDGRDVVCAWGRCVRRWSRSSADGMAGAAGPTQQPTGVLHRPPARTPGSRGAPLLRWSPSASR